jgi:UDP-glucuronate decarboxylase
MNDKSGGEDDMKKRILVTGGAGFIGSHLCTRLINDGHEVICLDNFFTGSKTNVAHLLTSERFELVRHDIVSPYQAEVDQIYNLACPASPVHYQYNPIKTIKCSTVGMVNMLGLAKRCHARILQASTSEVYGDPALHPQTEEYWGNVNPIGIRSCYDEGKRVAETLCMDYTRQCGVDVRIIRIFNTYGPGMQIDDGRVVSNFIVQALQNKDITIYGDGSHTRSFQYVSDLVEGMVRMMACADTCGPINIGNPAEFTIQELALKIIALTNSQSKLSFHPLPADDPSKRCPDISRARKFLAWEPAVPLEEGLVPTIAYFKNIIKEQTA